MGKYKRKFEKSTRIYYIETLVREVEENRYIFLHDKPLHHGFVRSMPLGYLLMGLARGYFSKARKVNE